MDIAITMLASLLLFGSTYALGKREIRRSEGIIFVLIYVIYLTYLIINQ
jgi:cation:H+ antiporter